MDTKARKVAGLAAIQRVQDQREVAFYPLCSDCRFGPVRATDRDRCEHFVHWQISPDRRLRIPVTTGQARSKDGLCGPEGLLFSPYKWWRLAPRWLARQKPETAAWILAMLVLGTMTLLAVLIRALF